MRRLVLIPIFAICAGCTGHDASGGMHANTGAAHAADAAGAPGAFNEVHRAVATLHPTDGNNTRGVIHFRQQDGRVHITGEVTGLQPNGRHGFHIHEWGDASAPDGTSAGGHYDPQGHPHAGPDTAQRHAGDLGNLQANADGAARVDLTVTNITIADGDSPILGRGVVVHAGPDDLTTQPTGDSGPRIAVGVIGVAKPQD